MLRLARRVDRSVACTFYFNVIKSPRIISRSYSTTDASNEASANSKSTLTDQDGAPSEFRTAKLANSRARRREQRLLLAEQRAQRLKGKATLSKEEPEPAKNSAGGRKKKSKKSKKSKKNTLGPTQAELNKLASDRTLVLEANQDAGGLPFHESSHDAQKAAVAVSGMLMTLRERLQYLSSASQRAAFGQTSFEEGSRHLGENAGGYRVASPGEVIEEAAKEADKQKKSSSPKIKVEKPKKSSTKPTANSTPTSKSKSKTKHELEVKTINPSKLGLRPVETSNIPEVPRLAHNLDRVLFNPGVYELQELRSRVYNFDPYLSTIMPVEEFDFNALKEYVTSSKDSRLRTLSAKHGMKYCGSTSSMTSILSHFHFLLSAWRPPNYRHLSRDFNPEFETFTGLLRAPAAAFARLKDGVYAIDADKEFDTSNVLSMLGKSMEKLLTLPKEEFEKYRKEPSHQLTEEKKNADEGFHYTTFGDFMLRSQLDAHDPRLPGTGMFDLKTRAVVTIRMDVEGYEKGTGYEIQYRHGQWESYEREYYDMIRAAFLKYSLQVRMGRMDGIFVAFHNTQRIFGFQYISLNEMDFALHGSHHRNFGDQEFRASLTLLNDLLNRASQRFPGRSLRLHVETRATNPPLTYFFAEPVSDADIDETQAKGRRSVERFETEVLGLKRKEQEADSSQGAEDLEQVQQDLTNPLEEISKSSELQDTQGLSAWDELMAKVDETVENDSLGIDTVRDAIEQALKQSGLLRGKSQDETESYLDFLVQSLSAELAEGNYGIDVSESAIGDEASEEQSGDVEPDAQSLEVSPADYPAGGQPCSSPEAGAGGRPENPTSTMDGPLPEISDDISIKSEDSAKDNEGAKQDEISKEDNIVKEDDIATGEDVVKGNGLPEESRLAEDDGTVDADDTLQAALPKNEASDASSQDPSLTDLILRVAKAVDTKTGNMAAFEVMLSKLAEQSKQSESTHQDKQSTPARAPGKSHDESNGSKQADQKDQAAKESSFEKPNDTKKRELLGMYVTVRNKVNGQVVERIEPSKDHPHSLWNIEYTVTELPQERAERILGQLKGRRKKMYFSKPESRDELWHKLWKGGLAKHTKRGEKARRRFEKADETGPSYGAWDDKPIVSERFRFNKDDNNGTKETGSEGLEDSNSDNGKVEH